MDLSPDLATTDLVDLVDQAVGALREQSEKERLMVGLLACDACGEVLQRRRSFCLGCGDRYDSAAGLGPAQDWGD